jgi:hypothetical protein
MAYPTRLTMVVTALAVLLPVTLSGPKRRVGGSQADRSSLQNGHGLVIYRYKGVRIMPPQDHPSDTGAQ